MAFALAVGFVVGWVVAGPRFRWSDGHALFLNDVTTSITFVMVFLIRNTQRRRERSQDLQAAELIRANPAARNLLIDPASLSDEEFATLERQMKACVRTKHDDVLEAIEEGLKQADES